MIIVEGPEGSGKTRLAKWLAENAELNYWHSTPPKSLSDHDRQLERSMELLKLPFVQDRTPWISEPIYKIIFGDESMFAVWTAYVEALKAAGAKVIYCRPTEEVIFDHMLRTSKPHKSKLYENTIYENKERLLSLYDQFMGQLNPWLSYDWTLPSSDLVERSLLRQVKQDRNQLFSNSEELPQGEDQDRRNDAGQ